jgi:hypothetical protein
VAAFLDRQADEAPALPPNIWGRAGRFEAQGRLVERGPGWGGR